MRGDNLLSICSRLQLDFVPSWCYRRFSHPLIGIVGPRKNEQVASLWFVLTNPQGIAPLSEEHALQFYAPFAQVSSTHQLDLLLASQFLNAALLAIGLKAATCQKGTIQVFCGERFIETRLIARGATSWLVASHCKCAWIATCSLRCSWYTTYSPLASQFYLANCAPHPGASASSFTRCL